MWWLLLIPEVAMTIGQLLVRLEISGGVETDDLILQKMK
jgi:hypothetical protein